MENKKFSLVIPCYNEERGLLELIEKCKPLIDKNIEVILVNNGSEDGTKSLCNKIKKQPCLRIIHLEKNLGYGGGILSGLSVAKGDVVGWTHADLQTDPRDFLVAIDYFKNNNNKTFIKGIRKGRPFFDSFFTIGMSVFESLLFKTIFWDVNAQPTIFNRSILSEIKNPPRDFSLDLFMYFHAKKRKLSIIRYPVYFLPRKYGQSSWNINWRSKIKFISRTIRFSLELYRDHKDANRKP